MRFSRAQQAIENQELYFSRPEDFNDPFDLHTGLIDHSINPKRAEILASRFYDGNDREGFLIYMESIVQKSKETEEYSRKIFGEDRENAGIGCFTRNPNVTLMWSHYADCHKGICLGFNIDPVNNDPLFLIQPITYLSKIESKSYVEGRAEALYHWVFTKSSVWAYEEEIRAFSKDQNKLIGFDKRCLKEIYFGCRVKQTEIESILALLKQYNYGDVECWQMQIEDSTFDLKRTRIQ